MEGWRGSSFPSSLPSLLILSQNVNDFLKPAELLSLQHVVDQYKFIRISPEEQAKGNDYVLHHKPNRARIEVRKNHQSLHGVA